MWIQYSSYKLNSLKMGVTCTLWYSSVISISLDTTTDCCCCYSSLSCLAKQPEAPRVTMATCSTGPRPTLWSHGQEPNCLSKLKLIPTDKGPEVTWPGRMGAMAPYSGCRVCVYMWVQVMRGWYTEHNTHQHPSCGDYQW